MPAPTDIHIERLDLAGRPEDRKDPAAFLAAFELNRVPKAPGCYLMKDAKGRPIYVGKAKDLRARLRSYLNESDSRYTVKFLMRRVAGIDLLVTTSDKEALLLENSLIKQHKPHYNVRLKDDKTYLSLRIHPGDPFPRLTAVRKCRKDGARYFGPYASAQAMRETLRGLQRVFPLRTCSDHVLFNRTRPCLYYQMRQCMAPCVALIDAPGYQEIVAQVILALEGRSDELERELRRKIEEHAAKLEFEQAAVLRDRLLALRKTLERQRAVAVPGAEDRDVVGLYNEGRYAEIQVLFYRGGRLLGGRAFSFERTEMPLDELLASFLLQYYAETPVVPAEVLIPLPIEDADTLAEVLREQRGARAAILCPRRGEKRALVELAERNARSNFEEKRLAEKAARDALEQVQQAFRLSRPPLRIECFDISTIQGDKTVASMVVFDHGRPNKQRYRRFSIRTVAGQDDFAAMREVLLRRYRKAIQEDELPDLVLIDGGKGQLGVAHAALKDLGIEDVPVVSIAKARALEEGGRSPERFFVPGRVNPVIPPQSGPVVRLLARVRDEAHRFAITFHRARRKKAALATALTGVPGVGAKRARTLLNRLGSVARIRAAAVETIAALPGFGPALAQSVLSHLQAGAGPDVQEESP
ncbi:MAG: excinuclease ABC subunit UvrC [Candidatus Hydrogenedentes bacterium]|nr:excinuclease ABC subunit UvrC [Candidatus Hydrogenedentota bacterium]